MDTKLAGKTALVTGASSGIGMAAARLFAAEGANVIIHCHSKLDKANQLSEELKTETLVVQADLREENEVGRMFAESLAHFNTIDALVCNAGVWPEEEVLLHEVSLERWNNTIQSDLTSVFLCCRAFMQHLADIPREAASIVMVGSTAALFGEAKHADYAAAKAGMTYGLTRSLKNEIVKLAPRGRVNAVCPGWTRTPITEEDLKNEKLVKQVQATRPMQFIGEAEDVGNMIVWLSSDALAGHVSGAIIPIAGGMEGRLLNLP